jgi:hypothetical protein
MDLYTDRCRTPFWGNSFARSVGLAALQWLLCGYGGGRAYTPREYVGLLHTHPSIIALPHV